MHVTPGYTPQETLLVLQLYAQNVNLEQIAEQLNRSTRSIISKLVREGVYKAPEKPRSRLKKLEMIEKIAETLEISQENLISLEKASWEHLHALYQAVCKC